MFVKCILDIGLQKTGSKARQQFFKSQLHRVKDLHVLYPGTGLDGLWHYPLCDALMKGDRSILNSVLQEAEEQKSQVDLLILSWEGFYMLKEEQIRWLKESLHDITAVIFLRSQDQLINSLHNQHHKSHRVSLQELLDFEDHMMDYDVAYDYCATLKRWSGVLGRNSVVPILFDKTISSVLAFFHYANINVDLEGYDETYPNRAVDSFGLAVLRWVKHKVRDEYELPIIMNEAHRRLADHFVAPGDVEERYSLTAEMRNRIMSLYEPSNEWVRREFFCEHPSLFPPTDYGMLVQPNYSMGQNLAEEIIAETRKRNCS